MPYGVSDEEHEEGAPLWVWLALVAAMAVPILASVYLNMVASTKLRKAA
jgi:hypothetical protein